jgi:hypothetical protein
MTWHPVSTVAAMLSVTPDKITDLIRAGQLTAVNVALHTGGKARWRVSQEALEQFILRRQSSPPTASTPRRRKSSAPRKHYV